MWGESPFDDVQMNDAAVEPLTNNPKGFIYVTSLINGWNKLKIKFQPYVKKKKWLMMAQVNMVSYIFLRIKRDGNCTKHNFQMLSLCHR